MNADFPGSGGNITVLSAQLLGNELHLKIFHHQLLGQFEILTFMHGLVAAGPSQAIGDEVAGDDACFGTAQDRRPFGHVFQLPNVPRPVMIEQQVAPDTHETSIPL